MYGLLPSQKKAKEGSAPHFKAQTSSHKNIHLSTCKVDRESLSIFFTWHHHCPGQLLAAPTSTIPWSQCMYNIHCSLRVQKKRQHTDVLTFLLQLVKWSNWPILKQMVLKPASFRLQDKPSVLPPLHHIGELWQLKRVRCNWVTSKLKIRSNVTHLYNPQLLPDPRIFYFLDQPSCPPNIWLWNK